MPKTPRILFWDLETSSLNGNFGFIISIGWKFLGDKKVTVKCLTDYKSFKKDPTNDKQLIKDFYEVFLTADIHCGHYSDRFDKPMLNTRLLYHNLPPLPHTPSIDTWKIARYQLRLNSNRLDTIVKFFDLHKKTPVDGKHWIKAVAGNRASIKYIVDHNRADILALEETYLKLRPLMTSHPNVNIVGEKAESCPICGAKNKLQKRGYNIAKVSKSQRYFCKRCGGWSRGRPERIKSIEVR